MGVNCFVGQFFHEIAAPVPLQALRQERIEHGLEGWIGHFAHPVKERRGQFTEQLGHNRLAVFGWAVEHPEQRLACSWQSAYKYSMSWDATDVALLKKLWACGHSAGQIASRLGYSRNAVSAKLKRMGQKRGRRPPTASPKIVSVPKRKPALLAGCARPVDRVASTHKPVARQPKAFTKRQLYAMLADAVRNTA